MLLSLAVNSRRALLPVPELPSLRKLDSVYLWLCTGLITSRLRRALRALSPGALRAHPTGRVALLSRTRKSVRHCKQRLSQPLQRLACGLAPSVAGDHVALPPPALALHCRADAPAATIRRAMPIRPLCPEKSSPRPAARAAERTLRPTCSSEIPKTRACGLR